MDTTAKGFSTSYLTKTDKKPDSKSTSETRPRSLCRSSKKETRFRSVSIKKSSKQRCDSLKIEVDEDTLEEPNLPDSVWDEYCSYCHIGKVEKHFSFAGVLLCLICFPVGFAWLFCFMEEECNHCGKIYS